MCCLCVHFFFLIRMYRYKWVLPHIWMCHVGTCIHTHACMNAHVCMYVRMYVCMYTHSYAHMCMFISVCTYSDQQVSFAEYSLYYRALLQNIVSFIGLFCKRDTVHTLINTQIHVSCCVWVYKCVYLCTYMYLDTHIHMYATIRRKQSCVFMCMRVWARVFMYIRVLVYLGAYTCMRT